MSARQVRRARKREVERSSKREQRLSRRSKAAIAAGAGLGATVLFAPAANAATFTVTSLDDTDEVEGTLREEVEDANDQDGDDTIVFQAGLTGAIELDNGAIYIYNDGLDIQGPGASQISVSGQDLSQVFHLYNFDANGEPVRIAGLTLTNGYVNGWGGALYSDTGSNYAAELTVDGVVIQNSEAANGGGGIWQQDGSLAIRNSTVSGNEAGSRGGGLYSEDTDGDLPVEVSIQDSTFVGNTAGNNGGAAAISDAEADIEVTGSTITDNETQGDGGALSFVGQDGGVLIRGTTLSANSAQNNGGGVYVFGPDTEDVTVTGATVNGNRANNEGGGILIWGTDGPVTIANTTVSGNAADADNDDNGYGGGVGLYTEFDEGERAIRNSTITGNSAYNGGGIYNFRTDNAAGGEDNTTISSSIVANNVAEDEGNDLDENTNADGSFQIGFSLIEDPGATATITNTGPNITGVDPQLGPLANNGGTTQTHAPAFTSPVLEAGIANGLTTDQRGAPRTFDAANVANAAGSDGTDIGAVELLPGGRLALAQCKGQAESVLFAPGAAIVGTDANDVIVGTAANDSIDAGKGNDLVCAGGGNDNAKGSGGKDRVLGEAGKDTLGGNGGKDNVKGGGGKDKIKGGGGADKLAGQAGADTLKGGGGKDTLKGGGGKDKLRGGPGKDKLRGGAGKDSEQQ